MFSKQQHIFTQAGQDRNTQKPVKHDFRADQPYDSGKHKFLKTFGIKNEF